MLPSTPFKRVPNVLAAKHHSSSLLVCEAGMTPVSSTRNPVFTAACDTTFIALTLLYLLDAVAMTHLQIQIYSRSSSTFAIIHSFSLGDRGFAFVSLPLSPFAVPITYIIIHEQSDSEELGHMFDNVLRLAFRHIPSCTHRKISHRRTGVGRGLVTEGALRCRRGCPLEDVIPTSNRRLWSAS